MQSCRFNMTLRSAIATHLMSQLCIAEKSANGQKPLLHNSRVCLSGLGLRKATSARSSWRAEHSVLVAATVTASLFVYGQSDPNILFPLSNALPLVLALAALIVALAALRKHKVKKDDRWGQAWLAYSLGMLLVFFGTLAFGVYSLVL